MLGAWEFSDADHNRICHFNFRGEAASGGRRLDVDTLMVIVPGGAATANMISAEVLDALGPTGILINMARGSVVDEPALIKALTEKRIMAAGLDVFAKEPQEPQELIAMDNVVLFPHVGSASVHTRDRMDQLVVDNIVAWAAGKPPLTPVAETPFKSWNT